MADLHPAIVLFFASGLLVFWLTPLSAWWMLSGQPDQSAKIWFLGTALYATVATLFVLGGALPPWFRGPFSNILSFSSVICMFEALRRELSSRPTPYAIYAAALVVQQCILNSIYFLGSYATAGLGLHLLILSLMEICLVFTIIQIKRIHRSRGLLLIITVLALFVLGNTSRVFELMMHGRIPMLLDFSLLSNFSLILNYISVVFYCYGYWGFMIEKNLTKIEQANRVAIEARSKELEAQQSQEVARIELRHQSEMMQRMAVLGKIAQSSALIGSIAHEINQPLASINLNIFDIMYRFPDKIKSVELSEKLLRLEQDSSRIASIVLRMKAIFRQEAPPISEQSVDDVLFATIKMLQQNLEDNGILLNLDLKAQLAFSFAADEIEHVFLNVLQNSIDVLRSISIIKSIEIKSWIEGDQALVSISDNGPGIPDANKPYIFQLRETSKENGSGLGLWLSQYIMERNRGRIYLDEKDLSGTSFIIQLPFTTSLRL